MRQRNPMTAAALVLAAFALSVGHAEGDLISITFDEPQLVNNDPILQFYNGGTTFRGIGPGPNLGVEFSLNARVFTQTSGLVGTFTTPGIMELFSDQAREGEGISATMNVQDGFGQSIAFDYAAIDAAGTLQVYSGADGAGTLLANASLPVTSPQTGPGTFVADSVSFSGVAHSVVFEGGNQQLAFDDLQFSSVPKPPAWSLLAIGGVLCAGACWRRRTRPARYSFDS